MTRLLAYHKSFLLFSFFVFEPVDETRKLFAQANSIENFRAVEVSAGELQVTVDYTYNGQSGTNNVSILATTMDADGSSHERDIIDDETALLRGKHTVTFKIQMRPSGSSFTSTWIRVCMATIDTAILCKDFAYTKRWSAAGMPPPPPPQVSPGIDAGNRPSPSQASVGTCTISGRVLGQRSFNIVTEPGRTPTRFTLTHMYLETLDKRITSRARINSRGEYRFTMAGGKKYRIYPANFRSDPPSDTVTCNRPNAIHHKNFRIIGGPLID